MSEYLVTLIPGAGNGTHEVYLMWPKHGVGELYEGNVAVAESSSDGGGIMESGIAVHDVTVGELLDSSNATALGDFPRLNHKIGAEEVYNMLITTLFLLFLLTTIALLIFLLMRRPSCCRWCKTHFGRGTGQEADNTDPNEDAQEGFTYLSETHGVVTKKRMWDNPPPYESPPDYHSLNPEIIMNAKTLLINASNSSLARKISSTVNPGVHRNSSSPAGPHGSPVARTPLMNGTGDSSSSPKEMENRKISLQCPPNRPPRLKRTISSPSSMPPTPVIQPPPHYDTLQDVEQNQTTVILHIDTTSSKS